MHSKKENKSKWFLSIIISSLIVCSIIALIYSPHNISPICTSGINTNVLLYEEGILEKKQKGAYLFGRIDSQSLQPLIHTNYNWITLVSFAGQEDINSPHISYLRGDSTRIIRRESSWKSKIALSHAMGLKVLFKPHLWLDNPTNGKWRSDIYPDTDIDWGNWKASYSAYILHFAELAEASNVEMFCIGTELSRLSVEKAEYWRELIKEVRKIYSGKLTYAANWYQEYEQITFWDELDYIGVQAYFPLSENQFPKTSEIKAGWNKHLPSLEAMAKKYNRKILFTELGYKSTANTAIEPWHWLEHYAEEDRIYSPETQANCYQAFFESVWNKEWMAGIHIWKMHTGRKRKNRENLDFTPEGKQAEAIIKQY